MKTRVGRFGAFISAFVSDINVKNRPTLIMTISKFKMKYKRKLSNQTKKKIIK